MIGKRNLLPTILGGQIRRYPVQKFSKFGIDLMRQWEAFGLFW